MKYVEDRLCPNPSQHRTRKTSDSTCANWSGRLISAMPRCIAESEWEDQPLPGCDTAGRAAYRMADLWGCRKARKNLNGTRRYQLGAVLTLLDPKDTWNGRACPYFERCEAERMSTHPPSSTTVLHAKRAPTQPSSTTQAPHSHSPAPISKTSISIPSVAARVRGQLSRKPHPSQLRIVQKSDS